MIKSLAHVCIKTTDLKKVTAIYCGAPGMEKMFHFTRKGEVIGSYMKAGNETFIEVFSTSQAEPANPSYTLGHVCLQADFHRGIPQRLLDKGYSPGKIKMGCDKSLQFWITDPNGLDLEFQQYTGQSSQLIGKSVEVN